MTIAKSAFEHFLEDSKNRNLYEQEKLFVDVTELLTAVMEKRGVNRAQLAQKLGKSKAFVTQLLRGRHNMTLRTLADLFAALDCQVELQVSPVDKEKAGKSVWSLGNRWLWCDSAQVIDSVWQVWWGHSLNYGPAKTFEHTRHEAAMEVLEAA